MARGDQAIQRPVTGVSAGRSCGPAGRAASIFRLGRRGLYGGGPSREQCYRTMTYARVPTAVPTGARRHGRPAARPVGPVFRFTARCSAPPRRSTSPTPHRHPSGPDGSSAIVRRSGFGSKSRGGRRGPALMNSRLFAGDRKTRLGRLILADVACSHGSTGERCGSAE